MMKEKYKINPGDRFGRLVVLKRDETPHPTTKSITYLLKCDCGTIITASKGSLVHGNTKSCGCLRKEFLKKRMLESPETYSRNRKTFVTFNGETHIIPKWASIMGMYAATLYSRYYKSKGNPDVIFKEFKQLQNEENRQNHQESHKPAQTADF